MKLQDNIAAEIHTKASFVQAGESGPYLFRDPYESAPLLTTFQILCCYLQNVVLLARKACKRVAMTSVCHRPLSALLCTQSLSFMEKQLEVVTGGLPVVSVSNTIPWT